MKFITNSIETDIDFIESLAQQSFQRLPQLKDHSHFTDLLANLGLQVCFPFSGVSFPFGNQHLKNEFYSCYDYDHSMFSLPLVIPPKVVWGVHRTKHVARAA